MNLILCNGAVFAVVLLYCLWRTQHHVQEGKRRQVRERVAYMLWVMSEQIDERKPSLYAR